MVGESAESYNSRDSEMGNGVAEGEWVPCQGLCLHVYDRGSQKGAEGMRSFKQRGVIRWVTDSGMLIQSHRVLTPLPQTPPSHSSIAGHGRAQFRHPVGGPALYGLGLPHLFSDIRSLQQFLVCAPTT